MEQQQCPAQSRTITITGISGGALLGPCDIDASERVRGLKRRLPDSGGLWRLFLRERELLDQETLAEACHGEATHHLTAIVIKSTAAELVNMMAEQRERKFLLQQGNDSWLREFASSDEEKKRQQRDADIRAYREAVASLVQQLQGEVVQHCKRAASKGRSWYQFVMADLQRYQLGANFFFSFDRQVRADPILRGWYFSSHGVESNDPADLPVVLQMGGEHNMEFIKSITQELALVLEQSHGLRVAPGDYFGCLVLMWGTEEEVASEGRRLDDAKWW